MKNTRSIFFAFLLLPLWSFAQDSTFYKFLLSIPDAEVKTLTASSFTQSYEVMFPQPVDHNNPNGDWFKQRIIVGFKAAENPTVIVTEGYGADWVTAKTVTEPAKILNANQLYVEHRYFGPSTPSPTDWKYLNVEQDAGDYHRIREAFGKYFTGKWVATGVSKGGQTTTEYKVFYPNDVDVSIPYVAPINFERLDPRINDHFSTVGTPQARKTIKNLQLYWLKNKKKVLPEWQKLVETAGFKLDIMDAETAYDYSVLEFPFSFWQYTADEKRLPNLKFTTPEKMAYYLVQLVNPYYYTSGVKSLEPAMYQFYTQLGYYEYDEKPFRKYLKHNDYLNSDFVPKNVSIVWDGSYMEKLKAFLAAKPQHMIYIYGESDPWGATAAEIEPGSGSLKMVKKNGTHGANIATLSPEQRTAVYNALEQWLGIKIDKK